MTNLVILVQYMGNAVIVGGNAVIVGENFIIITFCYE